MRIINYTKPPFDCLLQFNSNQTTNPANNGENFNKLFNSAINSYKFITCHYDKNKIENFRQTIYGKDDEEERVIIINDDVLDLFGKHERYGTGTYLRNFIIKIDDKDSKYLENNYFETLSKVIDEFLKNCFLESEKAYIYYKPRKFIYTTSQIYSKLPEYFTQNYKLINAPDTNNEEDILESIRTTVSERHEKRFDYKEVDWRRQTDNCCKIL